jgi:phage terminase Nu1 subunit (DNA packaging protein)
MAYTSSTMVRGKVANLNEVANIFGVSDQTVRKWVGKGCPVLQEGGLQREWKFSTADVSSWLVAQQKRAKSEEHVDLEEARRRKLAAEAELAELDAAVRRGDVVPIEMVAKIIADQFTACRARFLSIPTKLAPVLISSTDMVECRTLLEAAVDEALHELVGYAPDSDDGSAGSEVEGGPGPGAPGMPEAPAEALSQPMGGQAPEAIA